MIVELRLEQVEIPQGLLPRVITGTIPEKVKEYAEMIENGVEFDPIKVWRRPDGRIWLIDGAHRIQAHKEAGKVLIKAEFVDCRDELDYRIKAIQENLKHGIQLLKEEKVILAQSLYKAGVEREKLQKIFGVSERTIYRWLQSIKAEEKKDLKQKARQLYEEGYTQEEIAKELGVTQKTVSNWLEEENRKCDTTSIENFDTMSKFSIATGFQLDDENRKCDASAIKNFDTMSKTLIATGSQLEDEERECNSTSMLISDTMSKMSINPPDEENFVSGYATFVEESITHDFEEDKGEEDDDWERMPIEVRENLFREWCEEAYEEGRINETWDDIEPERKALILKKGEYIPPKQEGEPQKKRRRRLLKKDDTPKTPQQKIIDYRHTFIGVALEICIVFGKEAAIEIMKDALAWLERQDFVREPRCPFTAKETREVLKKHDPDMWDIYTDVEWLLFHPKEKSFSERVS